jgi:hypothetical protein
MLIKAVIRKIRWGAEAGWLTDNLLLGNPVDLLFMLYAYAKNERDDLTKEQLPQIREVVSVEFKNER